MLILAFDTSSKSAAVALLRDDKIIYDVLINTDKHHSEILLPTIDLVCKQAKITIKDIDLFACTLGPGSFTGLRIGVSTLKGLVIATEKPAAGVSTLAALASNCDVNSSLICAVMDAGRGQVYTASYRKNESGFMNQIGPEEVVDPAEIKFDTEGEITCVGDGALKYGDIITEKAGNVTIASSLHQFVRASAVGLLGRDMFYRNDLINPALFIPVYLRGADAKVGRSLFPANTN